MSEVEDVSDQNIARGSAETILVVEDDEDVRNFSCETLRELGYNVVEAPNGRAALEKLERHREIQVLFTDVGLPGGMNGRQLADEVRKRRPDVKVLFTTGYARNAIVHDGRLDPGVELIPKPFAQAALAAKLRDIIDARRVPGRILVVEDEFLIQMLATDYLEEAKFKVDTAGSATEAMNKLALVPGGVDAVIVDIGLPDRKGDELVREIRAIYPSLPIVLASGHGLEHLKSLFENESRMGFVSKPYSAEGLLAALRIAGLSW
jgi:CheY-like chemotaxis protein